MSVFMDETMVSFDVTLLFTSIPTSDALTGARKRPELSAPEGTSIRYVNAVDSDIKFTREDTRNNRLAFRHT